MRLHGWTAARTLLPSQAGDFAATIGAAELVLTHFSARYKGDEAPESLAVMDTIRAQAAGAFGRPARPGAPQCAPEQR